MLTPHLRPSAAYQCRISMHRLAPSPMVSPESQAHRRAGNRANNSIATDHQHWMDQVSTLCQSKCRARCLASDHRPVWKWNWSNRLNWRGDWSWESAWMFDHAVRPESTQDHWFRRDASSQIYRCDDRVRYARGRNPASGRTTAQKHLRNRQRKKKYNRRLKHQISNDKMLATKRPKGRTEKCAQRNYCKLKAIVCYCCERSTAYDTMERRRSNIRTF